MPANREKTAEIVRKNRLAKGYTQLQLAELTRISLRSIQRIESGKVVPRLYTLQVLAGQLDFELAQITAVELHHELLPSKSYPPKKLILSVGIAVMLLLFGAAFLSQSVKFPETNFEYFLFWGFVTGCYFILLLRIWK